MLAAALDSAAAGIFLFIVFVIAAAVCFANPKALFGLTRLLGSIALLIAGVVALASMIGLARRRSSDLLTVIGALFQRIRSTGNPPRPMTTLPVAKRTSAPVMPLPPLPTRPPFPQARQAPALQVQPRGLPPATETPSMLSKGDMAFYLPLRDIVAGRFEILIKPGLVDVLQYRDDPRWDRIAKMHVDFVLCDIHTFQPRLAIELDDRSHRRAKNAANDRWKEELLAEKRIPLLRQPSGAAYDVQSVKQAIERAIL